MRTATSMLFIATLLAVPTDLRAQETRRHYITDEGTTFFEDVIPVTPEQIEKAKHSPESLPADEDPEDHWGPAVEGFRLSIRLEKDTFTNGEPIVATILLRNVSDQHRTYAVCFDGDAQGMVALTRSGQRLYGNDEAKPGATIQQRVRAARAGSSVHWPSPVGTQRKFTINLSVRFDLTAEGDYVACARRGVPTLDLTKETNVVSGQVAFPIVGQPK